MTMSDIVRAASAAGILLLCPAMPAASPNSVPGEKLDAYAVPGEKLDSGLGDLPAGYTGAEFQEAAARAFAVPGEKLDSGLGDLPTSYTGSEFQVAEGGAIASGGTVVGSK